MTQIEREELVERYLAGEMSQTQESDFFLHVAVDDELQRTLKAFRIMDPIRGETERLDILNLMRAVGISTVDDAIALLGRYFPISAASSEKQRFLLKNMNPEGAADAPKYPR